MIANERLPITEDDVSRILSASLDFAKQENVDCDGRRCARGFTVFLEKKQLNLVAYNTVEPGFVYIRGWHYGEINEDERQLTKRYIEHIRNAIGPDEAAGA